jgi:hypothetical protein
MKVFASGRVARISASVSAGGSVNYAVGVPLGGDWMDVDDYFHQITSGGAINDVIHAKVVAPTGLEYSLTGGCLRDEQGYFYPSSFYDSYDYLYAMASPFKSQEITEWVTPNYKGKKKVFPRRRKRFIRTTHGVLAKLRVTTSNYRPMVIYELWFHVPKADQEAQAKYGVVSYSGQLTSTIVGKRLYYNIPGSTATVLVPMIGAVCSWLEANWGSWGDPKNRRLFTKEESRAFSSNLYSVVYPFLYNAAEYVTQNLSSATRYKGYVVTSVTTDTASMPIEQGFIFNEVEVNQQGLDPLALGGQSGFANYWRNYLTEHALLDALETFPKLSDNSISNALEVLGFVKALVLDHRIEIPKTLSQAWLAYRYQYKTTEMDVKEAIKFVKRNLDLGGLDYGISCRGTSTHIMQDGTSVTCRCTCTVVPQIVSTTARLIRTLDTYGLTPDFYVIWDMIPWSFMVDWFVPVGDMLGVEDINSKFLSGEFYKILNVCYSLSYTREFANAKVKYYSRWKGSVPKSLNSFYWLEPPSSSSKVTTFRVLDAASLFIGL